MVKRLHIKSVIEADDSSASGKQKLSLHCESQELEGNAANLLLAKYLLSCSPCLQEGAPPRHGVQSLLAASTFSDSKERCHASNVAKRWAERIRTNS